MSRRRAVHPADLSTGLVDDAAQSPQHHANAGALFASRGLSRIAELPGNHGKARDSRNEDEVFSDDLPSVWFLRQGVKLVLQ